MKHSEQEPSPLDLSTEEGRQELVALLQKWPRPSSQKIASLGHILDKHNQLTRTITRHRYKVLLLQNYDLGGQTEPKI